MYAQRLRPTGEVAPGWLVNGVPVCASPGTQDFLSIALDETGVLVAWQDLRNVDLISVDIHVQRVRGDGTIAPGWLTDGVSATTSSPYQYQFRPAVTSNGRGGIFVAWEEFVDARVDETPDVFLQHLTATGERVPGWPERGLAVVTAPDAQGEVELLPDGSGGVLLVWDDCRRGCVEGSYQLDVYAQRVRADGTLEPGWATDGRLLSLGRARSRILPDGTGGFYVASSVIDSHAEDVEYFVERFTLDGDPYLGWPAGGVRVCAAPGTRLGLTIASDGLGGVLLTWVDDRPSASNSYEIFASRVLPNGTIAPGWPADGLLVSDEYGLELFDSRPSIAPDGFGGAYVAWEQGFDFGNPAYVLHLTANGDVAPGWPQFGLRIAQSLGQFKPTAVPDGDHGTIVVWDEASMNERRFGIYANRFSLDGPVPVLLSLLETEVATDRVVLLWYGIDASGLAAVVQRRSESMEWETLGPPVAEGPDRLRFEDRSIVPGMRYGYRLAYREEGTERFTEETWVQVPALALSLAGFEPNPARGRPVVRLSLPGEELATLEVFDARGRVIRSQRVDEFGPGTHTLRLENALPAGIYWLRLAQAGKVVTAKGIVLP
ncbi:MAG: T9SS type A sorting domain-containing protein [Candidatus Eiseniibacteriota bacterium]